MALTDVQADCACENTTTTEKSPGEVFLEAHAAWRYAKAEWELALYAPGMTDKDLPRADDDRLSTAHAKALDAFLHTRSASWGSFVWKLRAFQEEEIFNNVNASEIVSALICDAERLHMEARRGQ